MTKHSDNSPATNFSFTKSVHMKSMSNVLALGRKLHLRSLISAFVIRFLEEIKLNSFHSNFIILAIVSAAEHA